VIARARNLDRAETPQMFGDELHIQKPVTAFAQQGDQRRQRRLAGIGLAREHAFAEKRAAQADAVKPAGEPALAPGLDAVRLAAPVQL